MRLLGLVLFLFIPVVLYLFVVHPEPLGISLGLGFLLMVGHRFLARPYMVRVAPLKCLWSNRLLDGGAVVDLELATGAGPQPARCLDEHADSVGRFFAFVHRFRWVLRAGIFLPLLFLLASLALASAGRPSPLELATDVFRLSVGLTVNLAAWGYLVMAPAERLRVPFPAHNFFLLGIRTLLWIFRLMGLWWIFLGLRGFFG